MLGRILFVVSLILLNVQGFSVSKKQTERRLPSLKVGYALEFPATDYEAMILMQRARACASSNECSVEDAEIFLHDVLHVQSSCASGVLMGNALCENQDSAAEIVANLRAKIEQGKQELQLRYVYFCIGRGIDACRKK